MKARCNFLWKQIQKIQIFIALGLLEVVFNLYYESAQQIFGKANSR